MRSFDLFDTLIGRLHFRPDSIFDLVEQRFPFPGFAFYRKAAEYKSDGTIPDIYRQFQQLTEISESEITALMALEWQVELSQIFPIAENCHLVQDGDLIITDTYYSESQVRLILEKIGLHAKVRIYASPCGKSSGNVWDIVKRDRQISFHLGDNFRSDVILPKSREVEAFHYENSQLTSREQRVMNMGEGDLACIMRALRLQNPYPLQSPEYFIWNEQCQLNIPILIEACLYLDAFCQKHDKRRVLFTSRDGCLWIQLFKALYPQYDSVYFHASRYMYTFPTPTYIDYVRSVYTEDTVIVDANGSGRSCKRFFELQCKTCPTYLAIVNLGRKHHAIVRKRKPCIAIEQLNYDVQGTLYDARNGEAMRCKPEFDLRFVYPSHRCIEKCVELISQFTLQSFNRQIVNWALDAINSGLTLDKWIDYALFHGHFMQNNHTFRHIHSLRSGYLLET